MKIGIDIDDVICNTIPNIVTFYNRKYNKNIKFEEIHSFNLWESGIGKNKEEIIKIVNEFDSEIGLDKVELLPNVKQAIIGLISQADIFFITSRSNKFQNKTEVYFKENFPNLDFRVVYANDFHDHNGSKKKSEICRELGIDIFIDDNKDYVLDCSKEGIRCFLINKPWNQDFKQNLEITRVNSLKEAVEIIKGGN